jgi:hypothetical protein
MISVAFIGLAIGLILSVISFYIPKCGILLQLCLIIGTQSGFIPQMAFMLGMCLYSGASWATYLLNEYFQSNKQWDTQTASTLCNSIAYSAIYPSLFISLGSIVFLIGGGAQAFAGLSKYTVLLSLPMIIFFLIKKVMEEKDKLPYILGLVICTGLAIGFIVFSGNPLAMAGIIGILMLKKPEKVSKHNPSAITQNKWEIPCTGAMWQALGLSTVMIGLPWKLTYEEAPGLSDGEREVNKGVMELLSSHFSTLLFLCVGMARTAGADAMSKAITIEINPLFTIGCIIVMVLIQLWVFGNMPALIETFLTKRPKNLINEWWVSIGTTFATCLIIGLPIGQCLILIGVGLFLNSLIERLGIKESIQGIFSSIPLIGIAFL